ENSYVTGFFRGSALFDTTQLVSAGGKDIFITKINTPVTSLEENSLPTEIQLHQNFPNPFNPITKISWQSPVGSWQTIKIYDVLGNVIATLVDEYRQAGEYQVEFNGAALPSGIYFYQIKAGDFRETKKMVLLK
ncbi:MAG: T9SS type A sorting domain-containing protein, partial [Ignavibacteriaceae bacterium]